MEVGRYVVRSERQIGAPDGKNPQLAQIDVELTERCNNACIHCCIALPLHDERAQARELSTAGWRDILRQARELGCEVVRFTGGEPLVREDFAELYLYARRLGLRVLLFTNARRITPDLVRLLAGLPPRELVEVSVYGMSAASYEQVTRAPEGYEEFRRGVELLLAHKVPFIVKSAVLPPIKPEMAAFEAWAATIPWMDRRADYSMYYELRGRHDSEARNRLIASLRVSPEEGVRLCTREAEHYRQEMARFGAQYMGATGDRLFACGAGYGVCVDAYGVAQPCMGVRDPALCYDLKNGTLEKALTEVFPRLREMRATNPAYLARCARCFLKGMCEQCPGKSWSEHGTLDTPLEYWCQIAHEQARFLGLLTDGERAWEVEDGPERVTRLAKGVDRS